MNLNLDPQTLQLAEASQLQGAYLQQIDHLQPSRTDFPPLYDETNPKKTVWDRNHTPSSTNPEGTTFALSWSQFDFLFTFACSQIEGTKVQVPPVGYIGMQDAASYFASFPLHEQ